MSNDASDCTIFIRVFQSPISSLANKLCAITEVDSSATVPIFGDKFCHMWDRSFLSNLCSNSKIYIANGSIDLFLTKSNVGGNTYLSIASTWSTMVRPAIELNCALSGLIIVKNFLSPSSIMNGTATIASRIDVLFDTSPILTGSVLNPQTSIKELIAGFIPSPAKCVDPTGIEYPE